MENKTVFREIPVEGYEQVIVVINETVNLHAIIAIHSTKLGPACGGIRAYPYASFDQAMTDVLRLSKGMTYKSAVAQTETGGAKSVLIISQSHPKTKEMLLAFAEAINHLKGRYYSGEDMGITLEDLAVMHTVTPYVVGLSLIGSSGDPSNFTARGCFRGIQAVCQKLWSNPSVRGKRIAVQGLGSVGMKLIQHLFWEGAELLVTDINPLLVEDAVNYWGAKAVAPDEIFEVECEIFSPCAIGGILNGKTIPQLKCRAVAGVANNQLLTNADGDKLTQKNILYAPDFVINAGGLLNISSEVKKRIYQAVWTRERVDHIFDVLLSIFEQAEQTGHSTHEVAVEMAEHFLNEPLKEAM